MAKSTSGKKVSAKPRRLGRGLDALLGGGTSTHAGYMGPSSVDGTAPIANHLIHAPLHAIVPNDWQPRQDFDQESLQSLADSIKQTGLMQPVVLRETGERGRYQLVAGERRWRAAGLAGLDTVPAMVREVSDQDMAVLALVENVQRDDLNVLEQAGALNRLIGEFKLTHEKAAQYTGQSRSAVTNLLRLLDLPTPVQDLLRTKQLQMGHCRALLALPSGEQAGFANKIARAQYTVRATENLIAKMLGAKPAARADSDSTKRDTEHLERALADHLGAPVAINHLRSAKGRVVVRYGNYEELESVLERMGLKH